MSRAKTSTRTRPASSLEEALAGIVSLPESEYQWAAGFIEADGCINIGMSKENRPGRRESTHRFHIVLVVVQKDPRPVEIFQGMFGGKIRTVTRRKTMKYNQWTICSNRAYAAISLLEPFLRVKKEQAQCAMALQRSINETRTTFNQWNRLPLEVDFYRKQLYARCRFLNSKEYISSLNTASREFGKPLSETIPSQATLGLDGVEGVTARSVSPNNNPTQERATRPQRDEIA